MKKKLLELQQKRIAKADELKKIMSITKGVKASEGVEAVEARSLDKEEAAKRNTLTDEIQVIDDQIREVEANIKADGLLAVRTVERKVKEKRESEITRASKQYSILKAMRAKMEGRALEGLEREMHEEAVMEAAVSGNSVTGIGVPAALISVESRDLTVGTAQTAGNLVNTEYGEFIPALRPRLKVMEMGASVMTGLQGDLELKKQTGVTSAEWAGEQTIAVKTDPQVGKFTLSPKRLAAFTDVSSQLLMQSSISAENWIRQDLSRAIARKLDATALNGTGAANQPLGILNFSDINTVAIGTDGGAPTREKLLEMVKEIAVDNADLGDMAFLTTPGVRYKLQTTKVDAGSGLFVWNNMANDLLGYRAEISTNVPSNLAKGAGTDLNAIIFGVWNQLIIGQWAGADIIVNPYTKAKEATVEVVVNSFWDINSRHDQAFSVIKDADVS